MHKRRATFVAAVLAASLILLASSSRAPTGHEPTIIGLGDIHGQLEPFTSMADSDRDGVEEPVSTTDIPVKFMRPPKSGIGPRCPVEEEEGLAAAT
jgi:hypothetical protein